MQIGYRNRLRNNYDLSNPEEIGLTDLISGGKSAFCSRANWIGGLWKTGEEITN